nr:MAG TPA: Repressor protein CI [Caudoviricetes sp.]
METLKRLRKQKGLKQKDVADFLGITVSAYGNYELDQRQADYQTLGKLADYFGVTVDYLLGRDTVPEEKPQIHIPEQYKDVLVAFEGGADDLTQEDVDKVIEYIELLRTKNRSKK